MARWADCSQKRVGLMPADKSQAQVHTCVMTGRFQASQQEDDSLDCCINLQK